MRKKDPNVQCSYNVCPSINTTPASPKLQQVIAFWGRGMGSPKLKQSTKESIYLNTYIKHIYLLMHQNESAGVPAGGTLIRI